MSAASAPVDPFVMVPLDLLAMVADGKLSKNAAWLYVLMLTHLNQRRGDTKVWPSRRKLAERMNLSQTRGVDRYIAELEHAGLIERDRRRDGRVNDTNLYTLRLTCSGGSALQSTTPRPAKAVVQAGQGVVRSSAPGSAPDRTRGSAQERTGVVRHNAPELDPDELKQRQQDPTSPLPPAGSAEPPDSSAETGGKEEMDPQTRRINALTATISARRPGDPRWAPDKVRKAIRDSLAAGKTIDQIEHAFPRCEADRETASPARLPLPFPWWENEPDCDRCKGEHAIVGTYASGPRQIPCPACRREPLHEEKCELHPGMPAWNCGPCRATHAATCPHPDHNDNADNCGACWAHVKAHQDPFEGIENLRPARWQRIYGAALDRQQRTSHRRPHQNSETPCVS